MTGGHGPENPTPDARGETSQLAILCVDDQENVLWLTKRYLEINHHEVVFAGETSPHAALDRLEDRDWDCVVSDYQMPRMTGIELLTELRQTHPTLPFLLCTTDREPDIEAKVLKTPTRTSPSNAVPTASQTSCKLASGTSSTHTHHVNNPPQSPSTPTIASAAPHRRLR